MILAIAYDCEGTLISQIGTKHISPMSDPYAGVEKVIKSLAKDVRNMGAMSKVDTVKISLTGEKWLPNGAFEMKMLDPV